MKILNNDTFKAFCIGILLTALLVWLFRGCGETKAVKVSPLKSEIAKEKVRNQELKKDVRVKDSVRTLYVHIWHKIKSNPNQLPCDTFVKVVIQECETVIIAYSSLIASQKEVIKSDSVIIAKQDQQIKQDSVTIVKLEKKVRIEKRKQKGIIALWLLREAAGVGAKIKN